MKRDLPSAFASEAAPSTGPALPEEPVEGEVRYVDAVPIGMGGMGRVSAVRDARLGRTVAMKEALDATSARRLAYEAALTARLEHPGIVTILDAGTTAAGHPYYTMQLVRGRTLAEVLEQGGAPHLDRIRGFLAVCEAVAYAHDRGIVHRDLKPGNILVGAFGESQVVDWGLAIDLDNPGVAGVTGTPRWRSPEQERGEHGDRRTDVWGLGAVLGALLTGEPPGPALVGPVELQAIVRRCLSPSPDDRYPDASAVADDVRAWLDGLRVSAHHYTVGERLVRTLVRWRLPLGVAVVVGVLGVVVTAVNAVQVAHERDLARAAEGRAMEARRLAQQALQHNLADQAAVALEAGRNLEAASLAGRALELGDSPVALGVLVGLPDEAPRVVETVPCSRGVPSPDGRHLLCLGDETALYTDGELQWRRPQRSSRGVWDDGPIAQGLETTWRFGMDGSSTPVDVPPVGMLSMLDQGGVWRGRDHVALERVEPVLVCGASPTAFAARANDRIVTVCGSGRVMSVEVDSRRVTTLAELGHGPWLSLDVDGDLAVLVNNVGRIARIRLDGTRLPDLVVDLPAADTIVVRGDLIAVSSGVTAPAILQAGRVLHRLPAGHRVVWLGDDAAISTGPEGTQRWHLPSASPTQYRAPAGLSGVSLYNGAIFGTSGSGHLSRWDLRTGEVTHEVQWRQDVLKPAVVQGGELFVASVGERRVRRFDPATLKPLGEFDRLGSGSVLLPVSDGVLALTWGLRLAHWHRESDVVEPVVVERPCAAATVRDGKPVVLCSGELLTHEGRHLAWTDADHIAGDVEAEATRVTWDGATEVVEAPVTALAVSETLVAAGMLDGSTKVWRRDHTELLVLKGHTERVSGIAFSEGALFTASWDATVRRWRLPPPP